MYFNMYAKFGVGSRKLKADSSESAFNELRDTFNNTLGSCLILKSTSAQLGIYISVGEIFLPIQFCT